MMGFEIITNATRKSLCTPFRDEFRMQETDKENDLYLLTEMDFDRNETKKFGLVD